MGTLTMKKAELEKLAEKYQRKADDADQAYQETGIGRYDTTRRNNEDLAEALRMAASAEEDHAKMVFLKVELSRLASEAASVEYTSEDMKQAKMQRVISSLLVLARMQGLIRNDRI